MSGVRLPPAYRLVAMESVASTNDEAKRLARVGAEDGTLVWAREQTGGRGRSGRGWTSPPGNLYLSLVLRPDCPAAEAAQLGFVAALGVCGALGQLLPPLAQLQFKWPNDILLNGRKIGGVLLETESAGQDALDWLVLGMGINVASHPEDAEFPATSLHVEGAPDATVEALLEALSRAFLVWADRWVETGFAPVRQAWIAHARGLGEPIRVRLPDTELRGIFVDLEADGALRLRLDDGGERRVTAGDVFFPAAAGARS